MERREARRPTLLAECAPKRSPWVTRNGRGRTGGPIARAAQRGLANPWRLPALHSPFGETEKGISACPGPQTTRAMTHALHPAATVLATIGDARFFEVEFVFNTTARFVGDLAVAQELINEFALGIDQLGLDLGGLADLIEAFSQVYRQYLHATLVARAQMLDRFIRQVVVFYRLFQSPLDLFQRGLAGAELGLDLVFVFLFPKVA